MWLSTLYLSFIKRDDERAKTKQSQYLKVKCQMFAFVCLCITILALTCVVDASSESQHNNDSNDIANSTTTTTSSSRIIPTTTLRTTTTTRSNDGESIDDDNDDQKDTDTLSTSVGGFSRLKNDKKSDLSKEEEEEEDEEEDGDGSDQCDGRLSNFVRNINYTSFLPEDYDKLYESMRTIDIYDQVHHINDTFSIVDRLIEYGKKISNNKDLIDTGLYLSSKLMDSVYEARISEQCSADLLAVLNGIRNKELWALKFPDSFAHPLPTGMLSGHIASFGEFDQCISIKSPKLQSSGRHIYGRYCQLQLRSPLPTTPEYTPNYEKLLREHPLWPAVMEFAANANLDNYLKNLNVAQILIQSTEILARNLGHQAVCFPASCTSDDLERLFNQFVYPLMKIPIRVMDELCDTHADLKHIQLDQQQWVAAITILVLIVMVTLATAYHAYLLHCRNMYKCANSELNNGNNNGNCYKNMNLIETYERNNNNNNNNNLLNNNSKCTSSSTTVLCVDSNSAAVSSHAQSSKCHATTRSIVQQFVLTFSVIENTSKLTAAGKNRYAVLDTFRLIFAFFVYSLQSFQFTALFTLQMTRDMVRTVPYELTHKPGYWFARAANIWIEGFVFILGIMLIVQQFPKLQRTGGQFSYLIFVWKRWYRLSISMVGTFFILFLYPLIGDGPLWFVNHRWLMPPCKNPSSILSSFLYYSNWNAALGNYTMKATFPICNPPSWFLSMSTQLYLLTPLIFLPLYHYPRLGLYILFTIISLSGLFTISPRIFLGIPTYVEATKFGSASDIIRSFTNYHTNPCQYVTALSIGMLTGYLIRYHPKMRIVGGKTGEMIFWMLSFLSPILVFWWHNELWNLNQPNPEWKALGWFVCAKFMFSLSLAYITYMCCTGRGGAINRLVTLRTLQPVAKLSYGIYLLRVPTIWYRMTSARHTYQMWYWQTFQNVIIDFSITAVLAYILYILFEAPSTGIMKIFEGDEIYQLFGSTNNHHSSPKNFKQQDFNNNNNNNNNNGNINVTEKSFNETTNEIPPPVLVSNDSGNHNVSIVLTTLPSTLTTTTTTMQSQSSSGQVTPELIEPM